MSVPTFKSPPKTPYEVKKAQGFNVGFYGRRVQCVVQRMLTNCALFILLHQIFSFNKSENSTALELS